MKGLRRQFTLGALLIVLSLGLYGLQIRLFHAERDTFFYLFQDLAFVPIQVLLVTVIVDQVMRLRERMAMLNKLNMVIGVFFSEVGNRLLRAFSDFDHNFDRFREHLIVTKDWTDQRFRQAAEDVRAFEHRPDYTKGDLNELKVFLSSKRDFLLRLLENQNLLEHETFTDLLWAVFHLAEELEAREDLTLLTRPDGEHIAGDIRRASVLLVVEWLAYMKHLKNEYPYLFSLALRTSPFDPEASVTVK
jgi:hypothetical protein